MVHLLEVVSLGITKIIDRQGDISYRDGGATAYNTVIADVEDVL